MPVGIGRRELIAGLGSAAAWPLAGRAQQPAMPVIGLLADLSAVDFAPYVEAVRRGLKEIGYVEGQNLAIEYRWADGHHDRLRALADDLVRRHVDVIVAMSTPASHAAKAATTTIPIVFYAGTDPVASGFVASLNRPGGNLTGIFNANVRLVPKRLELLHEAVPAAGAVALLVNPANRALAEPAISQLQTVAPTLGIKLHVLNASADHEIEPAFDTLAKLQVGALVIGTDGLFVARAEKLAELTLRHTIPAIFHYRPFVESGGLMSYGGSLSELYASIGAYAGRILKGEKPADLPVQQSPKVELIINLKTASALGITMPLPLLAFADEVIE
jgi:putative ABC transport system substrate-binding protein